MLLFLLFLVLLAGYTGNAEEIQASDQPAHPGEANGGGKSEEALTPGASDNTTRPSTAITTKFHTCRNPDLGGQVPVDVHEQQKYLLISGGAAGIGNFLIFYPSAFFFAVLTGRNIVIMDDSLIGEMCNVLICGYPLLSDLTAAYPSLRRQQIKSINTFAFKQVSGVVRRASCVGR